MKIPLYSQDGSQKGDIEVSEKLFGLKPNKALIHKILVIQLGNRRHPIAHTLTKGEVRGGGKKPYAQKHTGQARQGSITNPHFRGGGVTFGPRNTRNFHKRSPKKERHVALFSALSAKMTDGNVSALEGYTAEKPKTKLFAQMMAKLPFKKSVLFIIPSKNESFVRSSRNLTNIKTTVVNYLSLSDILKYKDIVFLKDSLPKLDEIFSI